jgi:hypothetical protein
VKIRPKKRRPTANAFCPTGPGGGVDPSCSPTHGVSLPVKKGKINIGHAKQALEEMGFKLGSAKTTLHEGQWTTAYEITRPDGSTFSSSAKALTDFVYKTARNLRPTRNQLTVNPFVSEAQRRACYAKGDDNWDCHEWSEKTKGKLPKRKPNRIATNKLKLRANRKGKKKPSVKASRLDPTRTVTMRRAFCAKIKRQFALLKGRIVKLVVDEDAFGLKEREPFSLNYSEDQARDERGRFGEGAATIEGGGKVSFSSVLTGLKAVGASASHIEHLAKSYAADGIGKAVSALPDHLPQAVNATYGPLAYAGKMGLSAAFAVFTSTQALAERTARERGHTPEQAKQLRGVLSKIDLGTFEAFKFSAIAGVHAAHLPALVTGTLPVASVGYLAYSTARDPLATIRAATGLVKEAAGKVGASVKRYLIHNSEQENAATVAMALEAHGFNDWYYALLSAALDEVGGVMQAIDLAHELYEKHPTAKLVLEEPKRD